MFRNIYRRRKLYKLSILLKLPRFDILERIDMNIDIMAFDS